MDNQYVPSELRSNILSFIDSRDARTAQNLLYISDQEMIDEMRRLGLNPSAIIAYERERKRDIHILLSTIGGKLWSAMKEYKYTMTYTPSHRVFYDANRYDEIAGVTANLIDPGEQFTYDTIDILQRIHSDIYVYENDNSGWSITSTPNITWSIFNEARALQQQQEFERLRRTRVIPLNLNTPPSSNIQLGDNDRIFKHIL